MLVHPYLSKNEANIDAGIAAAKANIVAFVQSRFATLWQNVVESATKAAANAGAQGAPGAAPTSPIDVAKGLWSVYSSSLMGGLQGQAGAPSLQRPVPPHVYSTTSVSSHSSVSSDGSTSSYASEPPAYPEPYKV